MTAWSSRTILSLILAPNVASNLEWLGRVSFSGGWEAGIRTPIRGSRGRSLTVRRPPSVCLLPRDRVRSAPALFRRRRAPRTATGIDDQVARPHAFGAIGIECLCPEILKFGGLFLGFFLQLGADIVHPVHVSDEL